MADILVSLLLTLTFDLKNAESKAHEMYGYASTAHVHESLFQVEFLNLGTFRSTKFDTHCLHFCYTNSVI